MSYNNPMELEWDEAKRLSNLEKHGLDFADASKLDWDNATYVRDVRKNYPEPRFGYSPCLVRGSICSRTACAGQAFESSAFEKPTTER